MLKRKKISLHGKIDPITMEQTTPTTENQTKEKKGGALVVVLFILVALLAGLSGYLFFMSWIPETFPKNLTSVYPLVYNYSYILAEGAITVALLSIPPVKQAVERVKAMAVR